MSKVQLSLSAWRIPPTHLLGTFLASSHKSILDYLQTNGLTETFDALQRETDQQGFIPDPKAKYAGLLEKKWTSVIRLQKKVSWACFFWSLRRPANSAQRKHGGRSRGTGRSLGCFLCRRFRRKFARRMSCLLLLLSVTGQIMELETRNAQLTEELASAPSSRRAASVTDWVPRNPPRHTLQGHRSPVTRVAFHPIFSQLVSASEDASLKLWDWETGEFERTVKGHTKAVQDVDFDSKGNFLGE